MLVAAFKALATQLLVISGIIAGCSLIVWATSGPGAVIALIATGVVGMKAPWVWTFGYGLAWFVRDRGRLLPAIIGGILVPNEMTAAAVALIDRSTSHRDAWRYTVPITLLGVFLTAVYGIPNAGVAYVLIFLGVCAIYYVAAFLLHHFVGVTMAFHHLFEHMDGVEFREMYSPLQLGEPDNVSFHHDRGRPSCDLRRVSGNTHCRLHVPSRSLAHLSVNPPDSVSPGDAVLQLLPALCPAKNSAAQGVPHHGAAQHHRKRRRREILVVGIEGMRAAEHPDPPIP